MASESQLARIVSSYLINEFRSCKTWPAIIQARKSRDRKVLIAIRAETWLQTIPLFSWEEAGFRFGFVAQSLASVIVCRLTSCLMCTLVCTAEACNEMLAYTRTLVFSEASSRPVDQPK